MNKCVAVCPQHEKKCVQESNHMAMHTHALDLGGIDHHMTFMWSSKEFIEVMR